MIWIKLKIEYFNIIFQIIHQSVTGNLFLKFICKLQTWKKQAKLVSAWTAALKSQS